MSEAGKIAIVTGAAGGIGKVVARRLAADGFGVIVNYAGNATDADALVAEIKNAGGEAKAVQADVAKEDDVTRLFAETLATYGRVDLVVNVAGIMPLSLIADTDMQTFDRVMAVNLRGTFIVLKESARHVREGGRVVVFSSSVLGKSFPTYGAYIASKSAVEGLVRVLANELRGRGVTVNAVAPGPIATDLFLKGKSAAVIADFVKMAPLERLGTPTDVANVVSFLAGPDGGWVNGQVLRVNGGFA